MGRITDDFKPFATGEFNPTDVSTQFPTIACRAVRLKARTANAGVVTVGFVELQQMPNGTTDTTTGFEVGKEGDGLCLDGFNNLNALWGMGTATGDSLTYILYK